MSISYWTLDRDKEKRMPKQAIESTQDRVHIERTVTNHTKWQAEAQEFALPFGFRWRVWWGSFHTGCLYLL